MVFTFPYQNLARVWTHHSEPISVVLTEKGDLHIDNDFILMIVTDAMLHCQDLSFKTKAFVSLGARSSDVPELLANNSVGILLNLMQAHIFLK